VYAFLCLVCVICVDCLLSIRCTVFCGLRLHSPFRSSPTVATIYIAYYLRSNEICPFFNGITFDHVSLHARMEQGRVIRWNYSAYFVPPLFHLSCSGRRTASLPRYNTSFSHIPYNYWMRLLLPSDTGVRLKMV